MNGPKDQPHRLFQEDPSGSCVHILHLILLEKLVRVQRSEKLSFEQRQWSMLLQYPRPQSPRATSKATVADTAVLSHPGCLEDTEPLQAPVRSQPLLQNLFYRVLNCISLMQPARYFFLDQQDLCQHQTRSL